MKPAKYISSKKSPQEKIKKIKIFIVDDHPIVRRGLTQVINQEPDMIVCGEAENSQMTLEALKKGLPDAMIVDLSLKNESGIELIKDIKARYPTIMILVVSMYDEAFYAERVLRAGAKGYIMKQQISDLIAGAIRQIISGEVYLSSAMSAKFLKKITGGGKKEEALNSPMERLSDRELEVSRLIGSGLGTRQIAEKLSRSVKTIETYRDHIKQKLILKDSSELNQAAIQWLQSTN